MLSNDLYPIDALIDEELFFIFYFLFSSFFAMCYLVGGYSVSLDTNLLGK